MHDSWIQILDCILRPARPQLERCLREREHHLAARRGIAVERAKAIAATEQRIEAARAAIFAANDGVVTSRMTELEREWRRLSRQDPDAGLMDLWVRIGPAASIDRIRWRDGAPAGRLDAVIAFAADAQNVEAAEAAIDALRAALAVHGTAVGSRIRWRSFEFEKDAESAVALLAQTLRSAREACPAGDREIIFERAHRVECDVHEAALARLPARPGLARDLAHAALVDFVWRAAWPGDVANPVNALRALWKTGYVLSEVDAASVTLEMPPLVADVT